MDLFNKKKLKQLEEEKKKLEIDLHNITLELRDATKRRNLLEVALNKEVQNNGHLQDRNEELVDWIIKILHEFGTYDFSGNHVRIPIDNSSTVYKMDATQTIKEERIHIPAITIVKGSVL